MVTLAQVNFFILTDTFNMCHPSYESMSCTMRKIAFLRSTAGQWAPDASAPAKSQEAHLTVFER
jgi:hypothetical protein